MRRQGDCASTWLAVANAIAHAAGVRIVELPLTPERVLRALRARPPRPTP